MSDMRDLESDVAHLAVLIGTILDVSVNIASADAEVNKVNALLWIARDLSERLVDTAAACHSKVIADRTAQIRMTGGQCA
jgi:hypothetical protein